MTDSKHSQLRLLIVSPVQATATTSTTSKSSSPKPSSFPPLLECLTSSAPSADITSFAGYTSHPTVHLKTKYYEKDVSLWCDELPRTVVDFDESPPPAADTDSEDSPDLAEWQEQMTSAPAREVRNVIGGIILILPIGCRRVSAKPDEHLTVYVQAVHHLREMIEDESGGRDVASVIVLQPADPAAATSKDVKYLKQLEDFSTQLEEWCHEEGIFGWDFVHWDANVETSKKAGDAASGTNSYGEKVGIERVKETLEAVDWGASPVTDSDDPDLEKDGLDVFSSEKFKGLDAELQQEMMGLKLSMMEEKNGMGQGEGEDVSPDQMQELMHRVVAIRDAGVELPKDQRQAFAKREVEKIIRELS